MTPTTETAKRLLPFFDALASAVGISTREVSLSISKRNPYPEAQGGLIRLPDLTDEPHLFVKSFFHELQHARDNLDGVSARLSLDELEDRARRAEVVMQPHIVDHFIRRFFPTSGAKENPLPDRSATAHASPMHRVTVTVEDLPPIVTEVAAAVVATPEVVAAVVEVKSCAHGKLETEACGDCNAARPEIKDARDVYNLLAPMLKDDLQESYVLVLCDVHGKVMKDGVVVVAKGQRTKVSVGVEDIVREVTGKNADRFVTVHNHPSGSTNPSPADKDLWKKIDAAFSEKTMIDCIPMDHMIIAGSGGGKFYSHVEGKSFKA